MRYSAGQPRSTAPVARSVAWVVITLVVWEGFQGLRANVASPTGSWALSPFDLVFEVLLPALAAFAFTRLFLVVTQSTRGSLNVYSVISSPYAWAFWVGLGVGLIGHGVHLAAHTIHRVMPDMLAQGEFAAKIEFLDAKAGYILLGLGFFLATLIILLLGQGAGQRVMGLQRLFFVLGSLATYGVVIVYMGVWGRQPIPCIAASVVITGAGLLSLRPSEVTYNPVAATIVPGSFLGGLTLIVWAVISGGQPVWP